MKFRLAEWLPSLTKDVEEESVEAEHQKKEQAPETEPAESGLAPRIVTGAIALVLFVIAVQFPLWQATLNAPQYPGGLKMIAYGNRVTGDVREINGLNHYIGMKPLEWSDIAERKLWVPMLVLVVAASVVGLIKRRGAIGKIARIGIWLAPVGVLADIQFRLWQYGHDLYPEAALQIPEFTPWVIGNTQVWNFSTVALPGIGVLALFALAADISFGPRLFRRLHLPKAAAPAAAGMLLGLLIVALSAIPAPGATPRSQTTDLQAMLDAAAPGTTVALEATTYHGTFRITKPVTIEGNGATLHGDGSGTVLTITADNVTIEDLTATHSAPGPVDSPAGIAVGGREVTLDGVSVTDSYLGIFIEDGRNVTVVDSTVSGRDVGGFGDPDHATSDERHGGYGRSDMSEGRGDGIAIVNSEDVVIRDTTIETTRDALYLSWSRHVLLDSNEIVDGRYGIHAMFAHDLTVVGNSLRQNVAGMVYMYGDKILVLDNHMYRNRSATTGFGLLVKDVTEFEAAKNVIEGNRIGIQVEGPAGADPATQRFVLNTVALNGIGAAILPSSSGTFSGNSFIENHLQIASVGGQVAKDVRWTEHGAGNFWSDYRGFDENGDGVGEIDYRSAGLTSRLLDENPSLYALIGTPAFNMTAAAQQKWVSEASAILDELPLMEPHSPSAPAVEKLDGGTVIPAAGGAAGLVVILLVVAFRLRGGRGFRKVAEGVASA